MKIQLDKHHGFKEEYVVLMDRFLNKEMTAEEVIVILVKETLMPMNLVDGVVYVAHPKIF